MHCLSASVTSAMPSGFSSSSTPWNSPPYCRLYSVSRQVSSSTPHTTTRLHDDRLMHRIELYCVWIVCVTAINNHFKTLFTPSETGAKAKNRRKSKKIFKNHDTHQRKCSFSLPNSLSVNGP